MVTWIILLAMTSALLLGIVLLLPSRISITPDSIKIGKWLSIEIPLRNIEAVSINDQYPKTIRRAHGFNSGNVKKGIFETPDGRKIRLYLFQQYPPHVEVIHRDGLLVFNTRDPEKTEQLYQELKARV